MSKFILFTEYKKVDGSVLLEVQLNYPEKLNVLNQEMIFTLNKAVKNWNKREDLSAVFIHSAGEKAFSAGGDVVELYHRMSANKKNPLDPVKDFFKTEYETDYLLHQMDKPVVLWGNGIVMGGGMGLFMSASHSIATEQSLFAMPEVTIGFFPDVGASHFLTKAPNNLGKYVALTACRLNAKSLQYLDLSKWFFYHKDKQKVFNFLKENTFKDKKDFDFQFQSFYKAPDFLKQQDCWIERFEKEILQCLAFKNLNSFYDYLSQLDLPDKQWEQNRQNFMKGSPSSLAIIFEQFKRAKRETDLKALFEMETMIAFNISLRSDFKEGVRALLVDKTKDPQWNPAGVHQLNTEEVEQYFTAQADWDLSLTI